MKIFRKKTPNEHSSNVENLNEDDKKNLTWTEEFIKNYYKSMKNPEDKYKNYLTISISSNPKVFYVFFKFKPDNRDKLQDATNILLGNFNHEVYKKEFNKHFNFMTSISLEYIKEYNK